MMEAVLSRDSLPDEHHRDAKCAPRDILLTVTCLILQVNMKDFSCEDLFEHVFEYGDG